MAKDNKTLVAPVDTLDEPEYNRRPKKTMNVSPETHKRFQDRLEASKRRSNYSRDTTYSADMFITDLLNLYDKKYPAKDNA